MKGLTISQNVPAVTGAAAGAEQHLGGEAPAPAEIPVVGGIASSINTVFGAADRNVALWVDDGKLDGRTALAVMAEVRAWLTCLGGGLGELLNHDHTEQAAARKAAEHHAEAQRRKEGGQS